VNDDAMFEPTWISVMLKCMQDNPSAGACAGLVVDGNSPDVLDSFGVGIALDGMSRQIECGTSSSLSRETTEVLAFSGCSCLLRKAALDDTGHFDERFFAYCEDTDLSLRIIRAGWKIITCPQARSLHYYSHTGGQFSLKKLRLIERNHHWVACKNFPLPLLILLPIVALWKSILQVYAVIKGKGPAREFVRSSPLKALLVIVAADIEMLASLPRIFLQRLAQPPSKMAASALTRLLFKERMSITDVLMSGRSNQPDANKTDE
jgi:GT2 family glycosyltransferase